MDISKLYKRITTRRDRDRSKLYITPFREWGIMLFTSAVLVFIVVLFSYYAFNNIYIDSFKEKDIGQTKSNLYNIENFRTELFETLQYYEKRTQEHNILLNEQPLFENQINIAGSSGAHEVYELSSDDEVSSTTDDLLPKIFNQVRLDLSGAASVWKAFFVDPFK